MMRTSCAGMLGGVYVPGLRDGSSDAGCQSRPRAKDAALTAAGYTVVRFTHRQLRDDPNTVADRIKAILAARYSSASASRNSASSESSIE